MQLFKKRLEQNCQSSASVFSFFMGQALDWIDYSSPALCSLIYDCIEMLTQQPCDKLLVYVLNSLYHAFGSGCEMTLAFRCLPKLLTLLA